MKYVLAITQSPYHSDTALTAAGFVEAALAQGHQILQIFFYHDGIYHALKHLTPPDDERHPTEIWQALAQTHGVDLLVCISAAQRRGLLCAEEAHRQAKRELDLAEGFRIAGLTQWLTATLEADRFLVWG